jgi:predicted phosphodiesterase
MKYLLEDIMLKIQFLSDLHLEFRNNYKNLFNFSGDILCLAGDISACGNPEDLSKFIEFIKYVCSKYSYIFHVPGNHEYYNSEGSSATMFQIENIFRNLDKEISNYYFMNCRSVSIKYGRKTYNFCGAALWSRVRPEYVNIVSQSMNDYKHIYNRDRSKFSIHNMLKLHSNHYNFIKRYIIQNMPQKNNNNKYILITHHKHIRETDSNGDPLTDAYETNLPILYNPGTNLFDLCIHGHTHQHFNKKINSTHFVSNPKGYSFQKTNFKKNWIIEL